MVDVRRSEGMFCLAAITYEGFSEYSDGLTVLTDF